MNLQDAKLALKYAINWRGKRDEHARRLFFRTARGFTPIIAAEGDAATFLVSTADPVIGQDVFLHGRFDDSAMLRAFRILDSLGFGDLKTKTFVDVGANIGTNCITAVKTGLCSRAIASSRIQRHSRCCRLTSR